MQAMATDVHTAPAISDFRFLDAPRVVVDPPVALLMGRPQWVQLAASVETLVPAIWTLYRRHRVLRWSGYSQSRTPN